MRNEEPRIRLKGKAALHSVQVKQEKSVLSRLYNSYIYTLRLPLPLFFLVMLSTPLLLSILFTGLYMVDTEGLFIPEDREWRRRKWWVSLFGLAGEKHFKVFIFSLSLSTTFGGTGVEARSPYNLLLANLNTLMAQLIFVFLSGAEIFKCGFICGYGVYLMDLVVFQRLSQPAEPIRWAKVALITNDKFTEHSAMDLSPGEKPHNCEENSVSGLPLSQKFYRSFIIRVNLADPAEMVLIECKFELVYRRFLTSPGQLSPFITTVPLQLVRGEVSYLRYALMLRHIIDESSPLSETDVETLKAQDASFTITVSGTERSSMQPVFSEHLYSVSDGDVVWDRQYEDQILINKYGRTVFHAARLSVLKPLPGDLAKHMKKQKDKASNSI